MRAHWNSLKERMSQLLPEGPPSRGEVHLSPFVQRILEKVGREANHRDVHLLVEGEKDLSVSIDQDILEEVMEGLLRNAIENTPDGGTVRILMDREGHEVLLQVQDSGIGISDENQRHIFEGFFPTQETDLYSSKRPYDFNAGGKGLDLFRMKVYGQRFGFGISVNSRRCVHLPTDRDVCWGKISVCPHCQRAEDCLASGGSTFCVSFPA
jgi:signal transduction histidine kinase